MHIKRAHSFFVGTILATFLPFTAHASGSQVEGFAFLWTSPEWVLSGISLMLLWFLFIHVSSMSPKSSSVKKNVKKAAPATEEYVVKRGDSLARIAKRYGITPKELTLLNGLKPPYKLKLGQKLSVPVSEEAGALDLKKVGSKDDLEWMGAGEDEKEENFETPEQHNLTRWFRSLLWFTGFLVLVLVALLSWFHYESTLYSPEDNLQLAPEISDDAMTSEEPTSQEPEPSEPLSPTEEEGPVITPITVLNGSGIAGEAGKLQTLLEGEGFEVDGVGNADAFNYETTQVQYHPDHELWAQAVEGWLTVQGYTVELVEDPTLENVVVVIGQS